MKLVVPKETHPDETRIAMIPESVKKLTALGLEICIESGLGQGLHYSDQDYLDAGATVEANREKLFASADIVVRIRVPEKNDIDLLKPQTLHLSYLDPFNNDETLDYLCEKNINAVSMEMIPRSTIAQKMDVLSSQASLGGYVAVLLAQNHLSKIFPMMMTPAGTLSPSRVFVIGAGVAGLQAIATAKRLGARVEAFDTRPVVEEQVQSLGAKFVKVDLGETGQTKDGYAKALTEEQLQKQREIMAKHCAQADVVITTAQVFGRKAPVIITKDMVSSMKPGSVIVDMAVETGGNVEGSELNQIVDKNGVKIIGRSNLPGMVPTHASQMLSSNFTNFLLELFDKESKKVEVKLDSDIMQGCLMTYEGKIFNKMILEKRGK